jgi:uncharacterized alpha-E superfamily protein
VMDMRPMDDWILKSHDFFQLITEGAYLFHGITDATMSHGEGWQFIQLGRYVERADTLTTLLETHFRRMTSDFDHPVEGAEYLEWVGLLRDCVAFEAYCKKHTAEIRPMRVAEFLLLNPEFPHSIRFSVDRVNAALHLIGDLTQRAAKLPTRIAGRLRAQISYSQIEEIIAEGVHTYLQNVRKDCKEIHGAINEIYFDYPVEAEIAS